jgi:pimeloyl-ACP methyl ester carboxylesterase
MGHVISKDGTQIAFDRSGSGPALILVDGAFCHRAFGPMKPLTAFLEPHFTVFAYDRRGRGESSDTLPYSVEREFEDIEALIQEAGGEAYLYGTSSGAVLAMQAVAHGVNAKKLAMYEPPLNDETAREFTQYSKDVDELLAAGKRGDAAARFMRYVGTPEEAINGMKMAPFWSVFESVAPTLAYDAAVMAMADGHVPVDAAAKVTIPTLVMAGGATFPFMHETAQKLQAAMPNAQYKVIEGQTHDVAPDTIAPEIIAFFAGGVD